MMLEETLGDAISNLRGRKVAVSLNRDLHVQRMTMTKSRADFLFQH